MLLSVSWQKSAIMNEAIYSKIIHDRWHLLILLNKYLLTVRYNPYQVNGCLFIFTAVPFCTRYEIQVYQAPYHPVFKAKRNSYPGFIHSFLFAELDLAFARQD